MGTQVVVVVVVVEVVCDCVNGVTPEQIVRRYTSGVTPSTVAPETRFVASETNATNCPSGLMTGL